MWVQAFRLAINSIRRHVMRSILTALGIIIGTSAVVTLVTLGNVVALAVQKQVSSLGANNLIIVPVQDSRRGADGGWPKPFSTADVVAIRREIPGVLAISGQTSAPVMAISSGENWSTTINGTSNQYLDSQGLKLVVGRRFSQEEELRGSSMCILGETVRKKLFRLDLDPTGKKIRLGNIPCLVIGVLKSRQTSTGNDQADTILMPARAVQRRFIGRRDVHWIVASIDTKYDVAQVSEMIRLLMVQRRKLPADQSDFNIIDAHQITQTVNSTFEMMTALVGAIASISLIVGGVGIMNMMLVSVTERTREIGIRLAVGALSREIKAQFLIESVVLSVFGGTTGMLMGLIASIALTHLMGERLLYVPSIYVISFCFSVIIGLVFGYYPAARAASLNPIDAIQHE